jgi:hypothetical protein
MLRASTLPISINFSSVAVISEPPNNVPPIKQTPCERDSDKQQYEFHYHRTLALNRNLRSSSVMSDTFAALPVYGTRYAGGTVGAA